MIPRDDFGLEMIRLTKRIQVDNHPGSPFAYLCVLPAAHLHSPGARTHLCLPGPYLPPHPPSLYLVAYTPVGIHDRPVCLNTIASFVVVVVVFTWSLCFGIYYFFCLFGGSDLLFFSFSLSAIILLDFLFLNGYTFSLPFVLFFRFSFSFSFFLLLFIFSFPLTRDLLTFPFSPTPLLFPSLPSPLPSITFKVRAVNYYKTDSYSTFHPSSFPALPLDRCNN